ncbi:extracellular solute-binding protein [Pseudonocardia sp. NPDC046786]|uniref:ABC transporter substrate-binding protein n=1 Tax=Pseudonocardia sp. NPDC046786 TaxID=3155471 RepID=UPI00340B1EF9
MTYAPYGEVAAGLAKPIFESRYPGLTVDLRPTSTVGYDDLTQQIVTDIAGGARPDVAMIGTGQLQFWVDRYGPQPIDPAALKPTYDQRFLEVGSVRDEVYFAPFQVSVPVLYTNLDLTTGAGVTELPTTTGELVESARRVKGGSGSAPVQIPRDQIADWPVQAFVQSAGLAYVEADGGPGFDSPEGVRALGIYEQLAADGLIDPISFADAITAFNTGRLAYFISTPALAAQAQETIGGAFEWTVSDFPVPDGGDPRLPAGGNGWIVLSDDACRAAYSAELIGEMLSPEIIVESSKKFSYIPVDREAAEALAADPAVSSPMGYAWRYEGTPTRFGGWPGDSTPRVNVFVEDMVQRLTRGEPTQQVVADMSARIRSAVR